MFFDNMGLKLKKIIAVIAFVASIAKCFYRSFSTRTVKMVVETVFELFFANATGPTSLAARTLYARTGAWQFNRCALRRYCCKWLLFL